MDWWRLSTLRALENMAYVVGANQGGFVAQLPSFFLAGRQHGVDFDGRILAQADPGPGRENRRSRDRPRPLRAARQQRLATIRWPITPRGLSRPTQGYPRGQLCRAKDPKGIVTSRKTNRPIRRLPLVGLASPWDCDHRPEFRTKSRPSALARPGLARTILRSRRPSPECIRPRR